MEVKAAVQVAIEHVADLFSSENLTDLGLEEVTFNDANNTWEITVGFSRPWSMRPFSQQLSRTNRDYKTVVMRDSDGKVQSVKIRELRAS